MFLSERRGFPSAPCLSGKETWRQLASRCCWNRARRPTCFRDCFLPGRTKDVPATLVSKRCRNPKEDHMSKRCSSCINYTVRNRRVIRNEELAEAWMTLLTNIPSIFLSSGRKGMKPREYRTATSDPARAITNCKGSERTRLLLFLGTTHTSVNSYWRKPLNPQSMMRSELSRDITLRRTGNSALTFTGQTYRSHLPRSISPEYTWTS